MHAAGRLMVLTAWLAGWSFPCGSHLMPQHGTVGRRHSCASRCAGGSGVSRAAVPVPAQVDMVGRRYTLIRPPRWGSRLAKRRKLRDLAELKAPW